MAGPMRRERLSSATWVEVVTAAGWRCECTGECGHDHREAGRRCGGELGRVRLFVGARDPRLSVEAVRYKPAEDLAAWCMPCLGAARRRRTSPSAAVYLAVQAGVDPAERDAWVRRWVKVLSEAADAAGYRIAAVFTDVESVESPAGTGPGFTENGLYALVEHVRLNQVATVVVPDLGHLTRAACLQGADRAAIARFLRASVMTVADAPRPLTSRTALRLLAGSAVPAGERSA